MANVGQSLLNEAHLVAQALRTADIIRTVNADCDGSASAASAATGSQGSGDVVRDGVAAALQAQDRAEEHAQQLEGAMNSAKFLMLAIGSAGSAAIETACMDAEESGVSTEMV